MKAGKDDLKDRQIRQLRREIKKLEAVVNAQAKLLAEQEEDEREMMLDEMLFCEHHEVSRMNH